MAGFEAQDRLPHGRRGLPAPESLPELARLEEVGDLHFHAAAYTTALDYFDRILAADSLARLPLGRTLVVLRKALTACLHLGWAGRADELLERGRFLLSEAAELDTAGLAAAGLDAPTRDEERARLQVRQAAMLMLRGDYQAALEVAKRAFTCLALTDQHLEVANLQLTMGACYQRLGRLDKAEEFYLDSLGTYRRVGDETGVATLHNALALLHKAACRWDKALALLDRAVDLANRNGAPPLLSWFHLNRGIVLTKMSRFAEAELDLGRCLRLCRSLHDRIREPKALLALGRLDMLTGRLARAEEHVLAAQRLAAQERLQRESVIADEYLGDIMLARGDLEKALLNYAIGLQKVRETGQVADLEGELLRRRAEAHRLAGDLPQAVATAHGAVAVCEKCGEAYELGFCHLTLGQAYAAGDDWDQADAHFRLAVEVFQAQHLLREWCDAVCAYLDIRLASADKPLLLLLRRMLLAVQEQAAGVGDRTLARCLAGLARVQLRLGLCDDALLTVFELERVARGLEDEACLAEVSRLRRLVEAGLVHGMDLAESPVRVFSGIPGLFHAADNSLAQHLDSILRAACDRMDAACGFLMLAQPDAASELPQAAARAGIDANLAGQLIRWYREHSPAGAQPLVHSRLETGAALLRQVPALAGRVTGCVFLPIALHQRQLGLLFLGIDRSDEGGPGFDLADLGFLASYMGFLALFLAEKEQPAAADPARGESEGFDNIITSDDGMLEMLALLRKVAASDLTVLLRGETGTGKGLLAYALHRLSARAERRFLSINCAAIPETLLESELFGHVKGAFTGADRDKSGLLVEAEGGTVFLDEIGKMPLAMQGKLLHFLDSRVVRPVGATVERAVDVRIVCASKADLHQLVESDRFLEDLYFRLADFPLVVPPLRDRPADIPLLARHFVQVYGPQLCGRVPALGDDLLDALVRHDWPGNIRELEKCIRRALVLARDDERLRPEHLPRELTPYLAGGGREGVQPLRETLAAVESREILQALKASGGNKAAAARLLRISYPNLLKKIGHYGLR
jgi:DNA-binding NtrC family response regulator/tetratricopeptide (TPR) repeat protein